MPMMDLTEEQIEAFLQGKKMSPEIMEQIDKDLDNPHSKVSLIGRKSAFLTRQLFDPDAPLPFIGVDLLKDFQNYPNN